MSKINLKNSLIISTMLSSGALTNAFASGRKEEIHVNSDSARTMTISAEEKYNNEGRGKKKYKKRKGKKKKERLATCEKHVLRDEKDFALAPRSAGEIEIRWQKTIASVGKIIEKTREGNDLGAQITAVDPSQYRAPMVDEAKISGEEAAALLGRYQSERPAVGIHVAYRVVITENGCEELEFKIHVIPPEFITDDLALLWPGARVILVVFPKNLEEETRKLWAKKVEELNSGLGF